MNKEITPIMKNPQRLLPYLTAGKCTFTLYSRKLDKRYTYHVVQDAKVKNRYIVSLFFGNDNADYAHSYRFLGLFYSDTMRLKNNSIGTAKQDASRMLDYFLDVVSERREWPDTCEFYPSTHCARCGRKLTTPESVTRGIGPDCLEALGSAGKTWDIEFQGLDK